MGNSSASAGGQKVVVTAIPWSLNRRQLEQWLASKGKTYKRPPMVQSKKKTVREKLPVCRAVEEEEKAEKPEQLHLDKINNLLTECLKLIEEVWMGKW